MPERAEVVAAGEVEQNARTNVDEGTTAQSTLGPRRLGLLQVVAQSLATNAPVFNALTFLPLIAGGAGGAGAGGAVPLSVALSAMAAFGIAWTLTRFSRHVDATGSVYVFISRSFGDRTGTAFGSLNYLSIVLGPLTPLIFGGYLETYLADRFGLHVPWWQLSLGLIAVTAAVLALGVSISTRAQLVWTLLAMLTITVFAVVVIVGGLDGGAVPPQAPFDAGSATHGWLGIGWGMLYGLFIFAGVESAQNLAEETPNPRRSIPRAMLIVVGLLAVYYLLVAYATVVGFRLDGGAIAGDASPLLSLAAPGAFGASWLVDLLTAMLLLDIVSLTIATCVYGSRGLFALARDGRLPAALTRVSRKRSIPAVATAVPVVWMVVLVVFTHVTGPLFAEEGAPEYMPVFSWIGGTSGLITAIVYGTVCLGAFGWLRRRERRPAFLVTAAGVGVLAACAILFSNLYDAPAAMYVALALVVAYLVFSFVQSTVQRRRGRFGLSTARLAKSDDA
ncbi:APC family permease [Pseudonocardia sp. CA-107938]|uniref:APC family permease n=1 Tax=Pseudonocardia sp. CA-107938 TaxID=3240021 RepID=UPI003D90BFEF